MKFFKVIKSNEIPQILMEYQTKLCDEFYNSDIELQHNLKEQYNKIGRDFWKDERFNKKFYHDLLTYNNDTIRRVSEKRAKDFITDIWNKINSKINNIEKIDLHISGRDLNGIIYGDNCNIKLETILAGGPIQRLHNRCLFKVLKKKDR